jgi:hypothetical protein
MAGDLGHGPEVAFHPGSGQRHLGAGSFAADQGQVLLPGALTYLHADERRQAGGGQVRDLAQVDDQIPRFAGHGSQGRASNQNGASSVHGIGLRPARTGCRNGDPSVVRR